MLANNVFDIYFDRKMDSLDNVHPALATALRFHWNGELDRAADEYTRLIQNQIFAPGTPENDLALADRVLIEVKIGKPFSDKFKFENLSSASAKLIAHYARFYWGFWSNHDVASDSIRKMFFWVWRSNCKDFLFSLIFMYGHVSTIRSGKRHGYYLASMMHRLMSYLITRKKWIKDFSKNIVFASYPYTQFISGKISSSEIEKTIEIGERLVAKKDPYYQCLLLISGLYGYAYNGNIAKTEIFCQKFQALHRKGKLLRYAPISEIMRLLPFALRGYGHLVEEDYLELLQKFESHKSDALIRSQFHRACAVISLILGKNGRALDFIEKARKARMETHSFIAWEKFDLNIKHLSQRSVPFDLQKDRLLNLEISNQSPPQLGPILVKLIELTPKAVEEGEEWLENQIKDLICSHIGIEDVIVSRSVNLDHGSSPAILIGKLHVEFSNVPETQTDYIKEILISLSAVVSSYFRTYQKLIEAQKVERDAAIVGLASETAHNILASLDALDFDLTDSLQDKEEQRIRRKNLVNRMKAVANGLLQRKKQINESNRRDSQINTTIELMSGLVDNIVTEKRVKYANNRNVEIEWELSPVSYSYFSNVDAPEFEVMIGNVIENAVDATLLSASRSGKVNVYIERVKSSLNIVVSDTGCGIPEEIKDKICTKDFSFGKPNGSGYGLFHATKIVAALGGTLSISSKEGVGTTVTVNIPIASPPSWFIGGIDLSAVREVFILDDDFGAHTIWDSRFQKCDLTKFKIHHFYSGDEFDLFFKTNKMPMDQSLFLFDFELVAPNSHNSQKPIETGLALIKRHGLKNAFIVSSYYRDLDVLTDCLEAEVKIIPKNFIRFVQISQFTNSSASSSVLIDDDSLVHRTWTMQALAGNTNLATYFSVDDFLSDAGRFSPSTKIYIDSKLGNNVQGEVESKKIFELGFSEIYLTTALPRSEFDDIPYIKQVISKKPPLGL